MEIKNYDIAIIGAGITGSVAALFFSKLGLRTVIIDKRNLLERVNVKNDGRAIALSYGTREILDEIDIFTEIQSECCPINEIRIADNYSPLYLHFDKEQSPDKPMGYFIENYKLSNIIINKALDDSKIDKIGDFNDLEITNDNKSKLIINNSTEINSKLILVTNGKFSDIYKQFNIRQFNKKYNQTAMTFVLKHENNHSNIAIEHFLPNGPFAVLPLDDGHRSGIVWSEKTEIASQLKQLSKEDFCYFLAKKLDGSLGEFSLDSDIFYFDLELKYLTNYVNNNVIFAGDAAHSIHPISGQGLNLGLADIFTLYKLVQAEKSLGLNIDNPNILEQYNQLRLQANYNMIQITDKLNFLFSNDNYILKTGRRIGLGTINKIPMLKKWFVKYAMNENKNT